MILCEQALETWTALQIHWLSVKVVLEINLSVFYYRTGGVF